MIFLVGPTAVGKSEVAIELALRVGGEIVSADSMQVYRGMNIGTAKPTVAERRGVPHHLLDALDIHERCDVARFRQMALDAVNGIKARGHQPIVVGGSGLYVRALTHGLCEGPGRDEALRQELEGLDLPVLRERLQRDDPQAAARIAANDRRRMVRALEFFRTAGHPISTVQQEDAPSPSVAMMGLMRPRAELYQRCDARVRRMFAQGFLDEARALALRGLAATPTARKAIGYAEALEFLRACPENGMCAVASATDFGQGVEAGQSPQRAWPAENNAAQSPVPPQPLRASAILPHSGVGSALKARCGDSRTSPPGTGAESPHAAHIRFSGHALRGALDEAALVELIQRHTRQFVKRQLTWFRRETSVAWLDCAPDETPATISERVFQRMRG